MQVRGRGTAVTLEIPCALEERRPRPARGLDQGAVSSKEAGVNGDLVGGVRREIEGGGKMGVGVCRDGSI